MTLDPERLDPAARACFERVKKRLLAVGEWREEYALGLVSTAEQCARYLSEARSLAASRGTAPPETVRMMEAQLKTTYRLARYGLALFASLPRREMNREGVDTVIATLCTPLPQIVTG